MKSKLWTAEETARALKMRRDRMTIAYIAEVLGRTPKAVKVKLSNLSMTLETRARRNQYQRDQRAATKLKSETKTKAPEAVLSERAARSAAPHRDLTAAILDDPPSGFSALDRKLAGVSA